MFKKLTSYQLTALWNLIEKKSNDLRNAARLQNVVKMNCAMDDLDFFRRRLQNHHAAVAIEDQKDASERGEP